MNRIRHRRSIALAILVIAFALVASACSSSDDTADDTATTTAAVTETTAAPDAPATTAAPAEPVEPPAPENRLAGMKIVDDNTFTVELINADAEFPIQLSYAAYVPLPSVAYENTLGFNEAPIGNGPFMFPEDGEWEHDLKIDLVSNPNYQGPNPALIDGINFVIGSDAKVQYLETLDGNLDVLTNIDTDFLTSAPTDFPERFEKSPTTVIQYLGIPVYINDTFTLDHRRALNMSIDKQLIVDKIFAGSQLPADSVVPASLGGRDYVCDNWEFDAAAAKALWDAAPPIDGFSVWMNEGHEDWIEAVVNMWGQNLGIDTSTITFEVRPWADYLPNADDGTFTGPFRLGWGMDYPSPLNFLEPLYASYNTAADGGSNATFYSNPDFDALLASGKAAVAEAGTLEAGLPDYFAAEDLLCADAQTIPVRFGVNQYVWNEGIEDLYMTAFSNVDWDTITADDGIVSLNLTEPQALFPQDSNESEGIQVVDVVFSGLVGFDRDGGMFMENAESVTSDDGGKTWTIVLKDGWKFHNGELVTAQSYVDAWSFGARSALGLQNNSFYKNIVGYPELNA